MSDGSPHSYQLRILTYNLWHGLNHGQPLLMLPYENPWQAWLRRQARLRALQATLLNEPDALNVFLLQEANPCDRVSAELEKKLGMDGHTHFPVNVGLRVGPVSYPFFLQEGLASLWRGPLTDVSHANHLLSGSGIDLNVDGKFPLSFHGAERRGATLLHGQWAGKRFTFVNMHLHSGRADKASALRRQGEVDTLMVWLEPEFAKSDVIFVAGDFNCEHGDAELSPLVAKGFQEFLPPSGEAIYSWDPDHNPLCARVAKLSVEDPHRNWDAQVHQLDHVYYWWKPQSWGKKPNAQPPWTMKISRVFDSDRYGAWISDHCGVLVDLTWKEN